MMQAFIEQMALHILIAGIVVALLSMISSQLINPFRTVFLAIRSSLVFHIENLLPQRSVNPGTIEIKILTRLLIPYFIIILINQIIYDFALNFPPYSAIRILLFILFLLTIIYAIPSEEEWDEIVKAIQEPIGMLFLIIKSAFVIEYYNPYVIEQGLSGAIKSLPEYLVIFLFLFPYSTLYQTVMQYKSEDQSLLSTS
jgi:hypothetical protein